MRTIQSYSYVGSKEIAKRVDERYEGKKIIQIIDIKDWFEETNQELINDGVVATFIINEQEELVISDRHSEHVMCAGGRKVLSAGEITFGFDEGEIYVREISNQSTGYCPRTTSWEIVEIVLEKIGIEHPGNFTNAYEFRYCENCKSKNLIKEAVYECAICGSELDLEWNMDRMIDKNKRITMCRK